MIFSDEKLRNQFGNIFCLYKWYVLLDSLNLAGFRYLLLFIVPVMTYENVAILITTLVMSSTFRNNILPPSFKKYKIYMAFRNLRRSGKNRFSYILLG